MIKDIYAHKETKKVKKNIYKVKHSVKKVPAVIHKITFPEVQKVKVINQDPIKFPETQKVEIINQKETQKVEVINPTISESVKFPEVQKVEVTNKDKIKFPETQKVTVTNLPKPNVVKFPDSQDVRVLNPTEIPIGKGDNPKYSNPEEFVPVRLTDGKKFYKAIDEFYTATTGGNGKTKIVETVPTDPSKLNPTTTLSFNAAGQMIYIDTIVGSDTYRETCSGTGVKLITDYVVSYTQTFGQSVKQ